MVMVRSWGIIVWTLVLAVAAAVATRIATGDAGPRSVAAMPFGSRALGSAALVGDLRLNEILAGPTRDWDGDQVFNSRQDEWLEVKNVGAAAVDLSPYRVSDADSTIRYGFSGTLPPGAVLLVTGKQAEDWQRAEHRTLSGLSLNNAGDMVILFRIDGADTVAVDVKTYNSIEGASDRSTGRYGDGDAPWMLFDSLNRYTGSGDPKGTGCPPSPGSENQCATAVHATTWGAIKMQFR
jgi:Lamin Tail Domain